MIAVLSDIHGNLEALTAVLEDASRCSVTRIFCLGDILGYGPDQVRCIEKAMHWEVVLRGHFEKAFVNGEEFPGHKESSRNGRVQFQAQLRRHPQASEIIDFLKSRPASIRSQNALFVHGSPRDPGEYVFPEDVYNTRKMESIGSGFDSLCFCGHTHLPGVFAREASGSWQFIEPERCDFNFPITSEKMLCNVGSVGLPFDQDRRASYVLLKEDAVEFRRVDFDWERAMERLRDEEL